MFSTVKEIYQAWHNSGGEISLRDAYGLNRIGKQEITAPEGQETPEEIVDISHVVAQGIAKSKDLDLSPENPHFLYLIMTIVKQHVGKIIRLNLIECRNPGTSHTLQPVNAYFDTEGLSLADIDYGFLRDQWMLSEEAKNSQVRYERLNGVNETRGRLVTEWNSAREDTTENQEHVDKFKEYEASLVETGIVTNPEIQGLLSEAQWNLHVWDVLECVIPEEVTDIDHPKLGEYFKTIRTSHSRFNTAKQLEGKPQLFSLGLSQIDLDETIEMKRRIDTAVKKGQIKATNFSKEPSLYIRIMDIQSEARALERISPTAAFGVSTTPVTLDGAKTALEYQSELDKQRDTSEVDRILRDRDPRFRVS